MNYLIINGVKSPLPFEGRILFEILGGKIISIQEIRAEEHVASLEAFLEIAKNAGFVVNCT